MQVPLQLAAAASHSNCSSHTHAPHTRENLFSTDQLFYGTHSCTTYNHSRIVNHFVMLSRTTANYINLPQQKTFTYHSPLSFLSLQIVRIHIPDCVTSHATIFLQPLDGDPSIRVLPSWGILKYNKINSKLGSKTSHLSPLAKNGFWNTVKTTCKAFSCKGTGGVVFFFLLSIVAILWSLNKLSTHPGT